MLATFCSAYFAGGEGGATEAGSPARSRQYENDGRDKEQQSAVEVTLRRRLVLRAFPA